MQQGIEVTLTPKCAELYTECHAMTNELNLHNLKTLSPKLEVSIKNLEANKRYHISLYCEVSSDKQYLFKSGKWTAHGPIKKHKYSKLHYLESAKTGRAWMEQPVNFNSVTINLYNKANVKKENASTIYLHEYHKYIPVILIHEVMPDGSTRVVFSTKFRHTEFIPVSKYHSDVMKLWKRINLRRCASLSSSPSSIGSLSQSPSSSRSSVTPQPTPPIPTPPLYQSVIPTVPVALALHRPIFLIISNLSQIVIPIHPLRNLVFVKGPSQIDFEFLIPEVRTYQNPPITPTDLNCDRAVYASITVHQIPNWIIRFFNLQTYTAPPSLSADIRTWFRWHHALWAAFPWFFTLEALFLTYSKELENNFELW